MGDRAAKDALVRRVRRGGQGARQRPPGRDRRRARPGRTPRRGARHRDRPERRQHLAPPPRPRRRRAASPPVATAPASSTGSPASRVAELWAALRDVAATHVADARRPRDAYLGHRDELEEIHRDELAAASHAGDVIVIDVRPDRRVRRRPHRRRPLDPHRPPRRQLRSLPPDVEIVAYCRGPYCVYADDAVRLLRRRGRQARRLEDGYPEWQRAGLPVESAEATA